MMGLSQRTWFALLVAAMMVPAAASAQDAAPGDAGAGAGADADADTAAAPATTTTPADPGVDTAAVEAIEEADAVIEEAEEQSGKKWAVGASTSLTIGQGTFVDPANDTEWADEVDPGDNAYDRVSLGFNLSPSYTLDDFTFSGSVGFSQYLTAGGGRNEPNEFRFGDIGLSAGWAGYTIPVIDTNLGAGLDLGLPTSDVSQTSTLLLSTSASLGLSRTFFERLSLSYSLAGGKDFHELTSPGIDPREVGAENVLYRSGGSEFVGEELIAIEGVNTEFFVANSFSAGIKLIDKLSGSVSYSYMYFWSYDRDNDDAATPDIPGNGTADTGRGTGDVTRTSIGLSYAVWDYISLSASLRTSQSPKTSDNKSFRFPFWNFDGAAANRSAISLGISGRY